MNRSRFRFFRAKLTILALIVLANGAKASELTVQIRSPKDGTAIVQEQSHVLIGGKVFGKTGGSGFVDIFLVLDVSGSTAFYGGVEFPEFFGFPNFYYRLRSRPCSGLVRTTRHNLRNSILAAEIVASQRLLSQLDPRTTRVGVITFSEEIWLRQKLTHDYQQVRDMLDFIYKQKPQPGTNMVDAIRLGTSELLGKGESEKYLDSIKMMVLLTDGFPNRPTGDCSTTDADLAIDAAAAAGKNGIGIHVFALGRQAVAQPRAAIGIARASGGTYTAVTRPADVLAVVDKLSAVGVEAIEVTNETIQQKALYSRLAADGFFASAVPVAEGANRIQVLGRASDGSTSRDAITLHYRPGEIRSLELEVFLEREKNLKLEIDLLRKRPK